MIPLLRGPWRRSIGTESRRVGAGDWGGVRKGVSHGGRASVWEKEKVLEMTVVMAAQQCECA